MKHLQPMTTMHPISDVGAHKRRLLPRAVAGCCLGLAALSANADAPVRATLNATNEFSLAPYVTRPLTGRPVAVAIGRITADEKPDVVVATAYVAFPEVRDALFLFEQGAGGVLNPPVDQGVEPAPNIFDTRDIAVLDIDGMHGLDVVVAGNGGLVPFVSTANGQLSRQPKISSVATTNLAIADLVGPGVMDIVTGYWDLAGQILRNNRNGTFVAAPWTPRIFGYNHFAVGDLDNDGDEDVAVASGQGESPRITLYRNPRNGTLQQITTLDPDCGVFGPGGVGIGEFTGDAIKDVVVGAGGNVPSSCLVLFSRPSLAQAYVRTPFPSLDNPGTLKVADIDVDGRDDIIVLHGNHIGVYLQKTSGVLSTELTYPIPDVSFENSNLAIGDISDDGCPDAVMASHWGLLVTMLGTNCGVVFRSSFE